MDEGKRRLLKFQVSCFDGALVEAGYFMGWRASKIQEASSRRQAWLCESPEIRNLIEKKDLGLSSQPLHRCGYRRQFLYLRTDLEPLEGNHFSWKKSLIDLLRRKEMDFETREGIHDSVKNRKPTWYKPDWAFIEEGKPIPKNVKERVEAGVLGDYGLGFGDGYFIHGTLYTRLLGKNITHGCIRVGDEDLKTLFQSVPLGTKVFIL
jgi:hypothetical protein